MKTNDSITPKTPLSRGIDVLLKGTWILGALLCVLPVVWMILGSLKRTNQELYDHPFLPSSSPAWGNYLQAVREGRMGDYLVNSLLVVALSITLTVVLGVWSGYALGKKNFPGRSLWMGLIFIGMILPVQATLFPLVGLLQKLGLHDSLWALVLAYTAQSLPAALWLLAAYFQSVPLDLEEAARLDGASTWRFYTSILMPIAKPGIATVVVITCLNTWNEFLLAMLLILDPMKKTLPAGMIAFEAAHSTFYPALLAGLTLISVPTLIVYAIFNRQVMRGMVAGAVKS